MPWLARIDPLILWKKRTLRFEHAGQEHIITKTNTLQKRMCHVISAVQFVRQIKKKNPAWICVIKLSLPIVGSDDSCDLVSWFFS
jgi:hypothetical protein